MGVSNRVKTFLSRQKTSFVGNHAKSEKALAAAEREDIPGDRMAYPPKNLAH